MTRLVFVLCAICIGYSIAANECGVNEYLNDCPVDCPADYCPKSAKEVQYCPVPKECPPPACKCAFNHRRAENGTCIHTKNCPPFACDGPHEVFNPCPPLCPTDDCSQATPDGSCPRFGQIFLVLPCNPKCRCQKSYWRKDGVCIPYNQCPGKGSS